MSKENSSKNGESIGKETMNKLREQSKKRGISGNELISDLLKSTDKKEENTSNKKTRSSFNSFRNA